MVLKDAIVTIEILSRHLPEGTEENHENPQVRIAGVQA
jgi:hypothetical protein